MRRSRESKTTAVLGPTNTGKTYLAIERMLAHSSGMAGFPLRLLARENYDRAVELKGRGKVALVTGEEKIIPPGARYFFCTVESMPLDRSVEFLVIDEVQMASDPERGHIFTDRLLHARGEQETMLLGADTIRPVLSKLVPEAEVMTRPRFSTLSYSGPRKITRLPARSAVVAFSAAGVYALAEVIRRQRGGTAVVLGALSPRTRNAQVALFDSGEVDYLVATDAIGMGLNLNLDHVAFSQVHKFDGRRRRALTPAEIGQIAGRAGRHMNDGTFGPTGDLKPMDPALVEAVENHRFEPLQSLFWRSRDLDYRSPQALLRSLDRPPPAPELLRAREADDQLALMSLLNDPELVTLAAHREAVALLWEVCQIPDFQKILSEQHTGLLRRIYQALMGPTGRLSEDWVARQIARIDRADGDIDALVVRIAQVRTWTYITHRGDWLEQADHWQARTRAMEDRLSDALHERLTQRFVDRRTTVLLRRLQSSDDLIGAVRRDGEVLVEGEYVGHLKGFKFIPDHEVTGPDAKALLSAARRALAGEIPARLRRLEDEADNAFNLQDSGLILWRGAPLARLVSGKTPLTPEIKPLNSDLLDGAQRERIRRRLAQWVETILRRRLALLFVEPPADLGANVRGIVYQVTQSLGCLPRRDLNRQIATLDRGERKALAALGLRLGRASVYFPALLAQRARRLRALLWCLHQGTSLPPLPTKAATLYRLAERPTAWPRAKEPDFYLALGFLGHGRGDKVFAIGADWLERVTLAADRRAAKGAFEADKLREDFADLTLAELGVVLRAQGFQISESAGKMTVERRGRRQTPRKATGKPSKARKTPQKTKQKPSLDRHSPFAKLKELKVTS